MAHRTWLVACVLAAMLTAVCAGGAMAGRARKKLLVVTHTAGFRHTEGIEGGLVALKEIAEKSGVFTMEYCRNADEVKTMMTPEALKAYDGVIFLNTTGDLGIPDMTAFLDWLKSGKAFVGMHSATDTYHNEPRYIDMIGAEFQTHHRQCEVNALVNDPKHPAVKPLNPSWRIKDEIYLHQKFDRSKVHMLLYTDTHPDDGSAEARQPGDYPLAWCKSYGKGRVLYTAFGHRGDVWTTEQMHQHVLGAIRWALGLARGSAAPIPALPAK